MTSYLVSYDMTDPATEYPQTIYAKSDAELQQNGLGPSVG